MFSKIGVLASLAKSFNQIQITTRRVIQMKFVSQVRSVRSWGVLGLVLALVVLTVGYGQEPRQAQPPDNPCQSIIDKALSIAKEGKPINAEELRKDLRECATKNRIPIVETEIGKGRRPSLGSQGDSALAQATNLPGGVICLSGPLPNGFLFWLIFSIGQTFTQPQYAGNSWNVATVQLESTRSSTLYSFLPGFGFSGPGGFGGHGLVRSVVAPMIPNIPPPTDLFILFVTWGPAVSPAPFLPGAQAVCMSMDRS
jgi:hypothetical protein